MECKYYQKLLHLYREDELTGKQKKELEQHLDECRDCSEIRIELENTEKTVFKLRNSNPVLSDPEKLTANIINAIQRNTGSIEWLNNQITGLLEWLILPKVRLTLSSISILLIIIFMYQETVILNNLVSLEEKAGKYRRSENEYFEILPNRTFEGRTLKTLKSLEILTDTSIFNKKYITKSKMVRNTFLRSYFNLNNKLPARSKFIIRHFQKGFIDYNAIKSIDSLGKTKFEDLLINKNKIMKYLNNN